jgi:hypothetical protein
MDKLSKRGKIPQQDWPTIIARHEAGETLASIARTYDCSPPAISYIVSRSRARKPAEEAPTPSPAVAPEPQLIKTHAPLPASSAEPSGVSAGASPAYGGNGAGDRPLSGMPGQHEREAHHGGNGAVPDIRNSPPLPANGDARRTLHLSLGNGGGPRQPNNPSSAGPLHTPASASPPTPGERVAQRPGPDRLERSPVDRREPGFAPQPPTSAAMTDPPAARNGGGAFLDRALRDRVDTDIAAFLTAFDAALAGDTIESRAELREATDRLLRAGARTRIELERLEARTPLPPREKSGQPGPAWRPR